MRDGTDGIGAGLWMDSSVVCLSFDLGVFSIPTLDSGVG